MEPTQWVLWTRPVQGLCQGFPGLRCVFALLAGVCGPDMGVPAVTAVSAMGSASGTGTGSVPAVGEQGQPHPLGSIPSTTAPIRKEILS